MNRLRLKPMPSSKEEGIGFPRPSNKEGIGFPRRSNGMDDRDSALKDQDECSDGALKDHDGDNANAITHPLLKPILYPPPRQYKPHHLDKFKEILSFEDFRKLVKADMNRQISQLIIDRQQRRSVGTTECGSRKTKRT